MKAPTAPQDSGEPKVCPWCHGKFVPKDADEALVGGHKICPVEGSGDGVDELLTPTDIVGYVVNWAVNVWDKSAKEKLVEIKPSEARAAIELLLLEAKKNQTQRILDLTRSQYYSKAPIANVNNITNDMLAVTNQICLTEIAALQSNQKGQV